MKLSFQPWVERRKRSPDASWASVLLLGGPRLRKRLEVDSLGLLLDLGALAGSPRLQAISYASLGHLYEF